MPEYPTGELFQKRLDTLDRPVYSINNGPQSNASEAEKKTACRQVKNFFEFTNKTKSIFRKNIYYKYRDLQLAVRTHDNWKLIKYNVNGIEHQQLFNLRKDPFETKNLAADKKYQQKLAEMTGVLKAEMTYYHDNLDLNKPNWGKVEKK